MGVSRKACFSLGPPLIGLLLACRMGSGGEATSGTPPVSAPGVTAEAASPAAPTNAPEAGARAPLPAGSLALVALGDSLTAGDGDDYGRGGYPERLLALVQSTRPGSTLANFGRTGWTSDMLIQGDGSDRGQVDQALESITEAVASGRIPMVLIWIGSNDLWYLYHYEDPSAAREEEDAAHFAANVEAILKHFDEAQAHSVLAFLDDQSQRPVASNPSMRAEAFPGISDDEVSRMSQQVVRYNEALEGLAAQYGALTVDFYDSAIFSDPSTLIEDGNHPNPAGYDLVAELWFEALMPGLE